MSGDGFGRSILLVQVWVNEVIIPRCCLHPDLTHALTHAFASFAWVANQLQYQLTLVETNMTRSVNLFGRRGAKACVSRPDADQLRGGVFLFHFQPAAAQCRSKCTMPVSACNHTPWHTSHFENTLGQIVKCFMLPGVTWSMCHSMNSQWESHDCVFLV